MKNAGGTNAAEKWDTYPNLNLIQAGDSGMSLNMKITFTNYGTNLLFVDDISDPPIFKVFVMASFDSMYEEASGTADGSDNRRR